MSKKRQRKSVGRTASLTIPELEQSKAAVLNTLASVHSRRSYKYAIERLVAPLACFPTDEEGIVDRPPGY